jgi:tetratricopeptide (TPR) repeat protein
MLGGVDLRRVRPVAAIAVSIVVGSTLAMPWSAPAQTDPRCAVPDALREAGEKEQARKEYIGLLKQHPLLACAETGLTEINKTPSKRAAAIEEAITLCHRGRSYLNLHRDDDALASYKSALEKNPGQQCAKDGIEESGPSTAGRLFDRIADALPQYLLALALALLALFVFLLTAYVPLIRRWMVRRRFPPLVSRILSPRLNLGALSDQSDKKVGEAIEARIKERLTWMRAQATHTEAPGYELDLATPREDFDVLVGTDDTLKSALDKASEATEHTKLVGAVLNLLYTLLPLRKLTVGGVVEPRTGDCASVTLNLDSNGRLVAAATVTGPVSATPDVLTAEDYVKVAEPAAVWVQFEVARAIGGPTGDGPDAAESYALVRAGLERQRARQYEDARRFYERARELDRTNWAAYANQGMIEVRLRPDPDYERAVRVLTEGFNGIRRR